MDYLTWTFFIRRLLQNPSYYDLEGVDHASVSAYLSALVEGTLGQLEDARCLEVLLFGRGWEGYLDLGRVECMLRGVVLARPHDVQ